MWLWIIPILIFFVPLILAWKTAGRKRKKYILIANCIGIFIIIAMLLLCVVDVNQDKRDEEKYDIVQGNLWDSVNYEGEKEGYYIVSGGGRRFPPKAIPVESTEISQLCYLGADVELYYEKGTDMWKQNEIKISGISYAVYDGDVVAIKFDANMFALGIIGWVVFFLFANSIICLIIAVVIAAYKKMFENKKNPKK